jgi:hypothetical protein
MPQALTEITHGRDRRTRSRLGAVAVAAAVLVGATGYAVLSGGPAGDREGVTLAREWQARSGGQQVLGGERVPGVPSLQRMTHDRITFTVTVAPARPGPNLVRVDTSRAGAGPHAGQHRGKTVLVGTSEDTLVPARPRPGTDGRFAVVDLPPGSGTVLVTHGRDHRVPFAVDTGEQPAGPAWAGPDGPECLATATAVVLATGGPAGRCPSDHLSEDDASALREVVDTLGGRGLTQLAVVRDDSPRGEAAYDVVSESARGQGMEVVDAGQAPTGRSALLVVSGWQTAARELGRVTAVPLRKQPVRSDGTWLAPWLLSPGVVDSTSGAVLPLDFDIRDAGPQRFSDLLTTYLPGQAPTASAYDAWREARGEQAGHTRLYAASRTAFLPRVAGAHAHGTEVAWFPGGTVTPVSGPSAR